MGSTILSGEKKLTLSDVILKGLAENRPSYLITAAPNISSVMDRKYSPYVIKLANAIKSKEGIEKLVDVFKEIFPDLCKDDDQTIQEQQKENKKLSKASISDLLTRLKDDHLSDPKFVESLMVGDSTNLDAMIDQCHNSLLMYLDFKLHNNKTEEIKDEHDLGHGVLSHGIDAKHLAACLHNEFRDKPKVLRNYGREAFKKLIELVKNDKSNSLFSKLMKIRFMQIFHLIKLKKDEESQTPHSMSSSSVSSPLVRSDEDKNEKDDDGELIPPAQEQTPVQQQPVQQQGKNNDILVSKLQKYIDQNDRLRGNKVEINRSTDREWADVTLEDPKELDKCLFMIQPTDGVSKDIVAAANKTNEVHLFGVASQYNGAEAITNNDEDFPGIGEAMKKSFSDYTQGPASQRTNPQMFEAVNAFLANGGDFVSKKPAEIDQRFSMLEDILDEDTKGLLKNGYLMSHAKDFSDLKKLLEVFKKNGQNLQTFSYSTNPSSNGANNYKVDTSIIEKDGPVKGSKVHLMLMAAPAWGRYSSDHIGSGGKPVAESDEGKEISKIVAKNNFLAQFAKTLNLALEDENKGKTIYSHIAGIGLGVFKNDPKSVGEGLKEAALIFQKELKKINEERNEKGLESLKINISFDNFKDNKDSDAYKAAKTAGFSDQKCEQE